ncbi:hypothetical protein F2Q69_00048647 [Brassica cretica]|uniref:Uncharacterized protein n=1 Tax=Brassica cretica TaxID=69181 RepID=A0A8S9PKN2_BRACR|nr:hypothetical protein F2Q69_00048647 [Brassica cretica]
MLGIRLPEVNLSHALHNGVKPDKQRGCKSPNASDIAKAIEVIRAEGVLKMFRWSRCSQASIAAPTGLLLTAFNNGLLKLSRLVDITPMAITQRLWERDPKKPPVNIFGAVDPVGQTLETQIYALLLSSHRPQARFERRAVGSEISPLQALSCPVTQFSHLARPEKKSGFRMILQPNLIIDRRT